MAVSGAGQCVRLGRALLTPHRWPERIRLLDNWPVGPTHAPMFTGHVQGWGRCQGNQTIPVFEDIHSFSSFILQSTFLGT